MVEWWSYGLSDFLMFSPEAYWRLVARYNAAWWPAQLAGVAGALAVLVLPHRGSPAATRAALAVLALGWAWVGWGFHAQRYSEIFLAAAWVGAACGVQALLLLAATALPARDRVPARGAALAGTLLVLLALAYPLLAPASGRAWDAAEVFGFMPEPTALATVGALLVLPLAAALRVLLAILPLLSLLLGAATRWLIA